ncbi:Conserved hypothetical protein with ImpA domain(probable component of SST VI cluster) [Xenorhabdus poinarii G6]|uniref:ImpA N-terminal domain-containing protein n=1 Tax=Xenorhabdus poinarii G6 TaxID=1354304 RepID=A0A068R2S9_9GAMM|nr:type VI secretion system protein TssA [Xenorhabdus poinarii]CDG21493.1 Conserved hypothetical protein with ImpA domain(probable component of SST VI cluster) [Xenorhabdus poinarii G6]
MNIDALLTPIRADSPCGENLEYDDEFLTLEQILIEKPEQQFGDLLIPAESPNWIEVEKHAIHLLSRAKDLRVIIALMQAWLNLRGLQGYADGLTLLRQILERYWEEVWPRLEFNGEYDHVFRLNTLAAIEDGSPCTIKAQYSIILKSASTELSLLDVCSLLNGTVTDVKGYTGGRSRLIVELEKQSDSAEILAITTIREQLTALNDIIRHHLSDSHVPDMPQFLKLLDTLIEFYRAHTSDITLPGNTANSDVAGEASFLKQKTASEQTTATTAIPERTDKVRLAHWYEADVSCRDDARILLEKAKDYFLKHEPSHPAPMMIDRILRLIDSDFIKIIYDLVPEGLDQIENIFGRPKNTDIDS